MHASLPETISPQTIAACLGISERAVRLQAARDRWPKIKKQVKGGFSLLFMVSGLPGHVRTALVKRPSTLHTDPSIKAGYTRAKELSNETTAAHTAQHHTTEENLAAFQSLPQEKKQQAEARLEILRTRDAFISASNLPKKKATTLFIREYKAGAIQLPEWITDTVSTSLSYPTLYRWEKNFQDAGLAGLASTYAATRSSHIAQHMQGFIKGMLTASPHLCIPTVREALEARFAGQAIPSDSSIRRFVSNWRQANQSLIQYLTSPDQWRNHHMIALGKADEYITRLNQVWEFDSTPGDVMLKDGRHNIIGVIDVYSRRAKVFVSPTSKSTAVAALTRRAMLDWGVPETAKTDNGADYVSRHMVRVFEDLQIWQQICRPFHPEDKPFIERFFWTLLHGIFELLPGYIGHSVAERKQIEARKSFAKRIMGQGFNPIEIKLTSHQLQEICDHWCNDIYHNNSHRGLKGKTPLQMEREWTEPVRRIQNEHALDILLSPAPDKEGTRVITKHGIQVENGTFIAPALGPHVGKTVYVLLDALDWGTIHVFLINRDGSKEFLCQAIEPDRVACNRMEIARTAKQYQKEYMQEASRELRRLSKQAAVHRIHEEILAHRERQSANISNFPQSGIEHTTPAIQEAARAVEEIRRAEAGPVPIGLTREQDEAAAKLIDMATRRNGGRPLPATNQEKYEYMCQDLSAGMDLPDADLAWMKRYEIWLTTGEKISQY